MTDSARDAAARSALLACLRDPTHMCGIDLPIWDVLIPLARRTRTLSRLASDAASHDLLGEIPGLPRRHLLAARRFADDNTRMIRWELDRLEHALRALPGPTILLKGAAYIAADLAVAAGRMTSDIDLLLPREQLEDAEALLTREGWETTVVDDYDDHFYRTWSHELPPMRHRARGTVADVHHTIVPLTSRLTPSARALIEAARPLASAPFFSVLAPEDMVLHSAVHGFHDGELAHALRDALDIRDLVGELGASPTSSASLGQAPASGRG
jgi:hypothetical protein